MKHAVIAVALFGLLFLAGCVATPSQKAAEDTSKAQQVAQTEEQTLDEVQNITSAIDELNAIEEEINTTALDEIDFDLGI